MLYFIIGTCIKSGVKLIIPVLELNEKVPAAQCIGNAPERPET
jgi:hypothetical protein